MQSIFTAKNTKWEIDIDEKGNRSEYLIYTGDMRELVEQTGKTEDELYKLLGEYEEESRDSIETKREIDEARKGQY